jgi:aryl-alcohol dehydrogenase-like predicted oxidoreductase
MRYATLPGADLRVSSISLGTAALGSVVERAGSFALLDAFVQAGGTFIDTAHVYADWHGGERALSEKTVGAWLRASGLHDQAELHLAGYCGMLSIEAEDSMMSRREGLTRAAHLLRDTLIDAAPDSPWWPAVADTDEGRLTDATLR